MAKDCLPPHRPGKKLIFRVWRWCPKAKRTLYAPAYGLRAWPLWVDEDDK